MKVELFGSNDRGEKSPITVTTVLRIGRNKQLDLPLRNGQVSRTHCNIEVRGGGVFLVDLESLNGTFVNGERIGGDNTGGETELNDGDDIHIGGFEFFIRIHTDEEPEDT